MKFFRAQELENWGNLSLSLSLTAVRSHVIPTPHGIIHNSHLVHSTGFLRSNMKATMRLYTDLLEFHKHSHILWLSFVKKDNVVLPRVSIKFRSKYKHSIFVYIYHVMRELTENFHQLGGWH